jgi:hypothetical protein
VKKRAEERTRSAQQVAASKAATQLAKQRADRMRKAKVPPEELTFYYQCPDGDCGGPGIWIKGSAHSRTGVPGGMLEEDMWWSTYHDLGDPYPATDIICQCCYERPGADGKPSKRRVKLRLFHASKKPVINPRWIGPRKPLYDPVTDKMTEMVPCGYTPGQFEDLCNGKEVVLDDFEKAAARAGGGR